MQAEFDPNNPRCVECGASYALPIRPQGGGTVKIYCSTKCRANSWARKHTAKRKISILKYDRKPASLENKRARARRARFAKYKVTESVILAKLDKQGNVCAGCLFPLGIGDARIDHCHKTEKETGEIKIRGLLCDRCNWALGHAKDDPSTLIRLAEYLNEQNHISDRFATEQEDSVASE